MISNIFVMRYINLSNVAAVAGTGVGQHVEKFILPARFFGITMTTFASQNLGAKRYKSIRNIYYCYPLTQFASVSCWLCTSLLFGVA